MPTGTPTSIGMSFTRWGRSTCPDTNGTELLYQGVMAGSSFNEAGSTEYICLHQQPEFLNTTAGLQRHRGTLYGTEYEVFDDPPVFGNLLRHDAPCAVCYTSSRAAKITIPGRVSCPPTWTREYYGYFMAESPIFDDHLGKAPVCIDIQAESLPGSIGSNVKSLLYFLETTCTGIPCPPYSNGAEITCAVCSKWVFGELCNYLRYFISSTIASCSTVANRFGSGSFVSLYLIMQPVSAALRVLIIAPVLLWLQKSSSVTASLLTESFHCRKFLGNVHNHTYRQ